MAVERGKKKKTERRKDGDVRRAQCWMSRGQELSGVARPIRKVLCRSAERQDRQEQTSEC